jgi:uncharacterized membrane protein YidH (DUF202 family)
MAGMTVGTFLFYLRVAIAAIGFGLAAFAGWAMHDMDRQMRRRPRPPL